MSVMERSGQFPAETRMERVLDSKDMLKEPGLSRREEFWKSLENKDC